MKKHLLPALLLCPILLLAGCDSEPKVTPYTAELSALSGTAWTGVNGEFVFALVFGDEQARLYSTNGTGDGAQIDDCCGKWTIANDEFSITDPATEEELCTYRWKIANYDDVPKITLAGGITLESAGNAVLDDAKSLAEGKLAK